MVLEGFNEAGRVQEYNERGVHPATTASGVGTRLASSAIGAKTGAELLSPGGPWGMALGAVGGGIAGALFGEGAGDWVEQQVNDAVCPG